jgi:hypothetical protein
MNPIINNNSESNNTMKLSFHWTAAFKDGPDVMQIDENGVENRFQLVKDRFSDLTEFYLYNEELSKIFIVDLVKGNIKFGHVHILEDDNVKIKQNIRLIFFRRNQVIFSLNGKQMEHIIIYHLGFQYQDEEGKNKKTIIKIDSKGSWILGE